MRTAECLRETRSLRHQTFSRYPSRLYSRYNDDAHFQCYLDHLKQLLVLEMLLEMTSDYYI